MKPYRKKRLLLFIPLPPPFHGSNAINQTVSDCIELNELFDVAIQPLRYSSSISDIGKLRLEKMFLFLKYLFCLASHLVNKKPDFIYFVPAVTGLSFLRECVYVFIMKIFGTSIIYHLHGKGIKQKIQNPLYKALYRWFFHREYIIHLSSKLYSDLHGVVRPQQLWYVANGIQVDNPHNASKNYSSKEFVTILYLSNLHHTKGPIVLLDACEILKNKGYCFSVIFSGNPTQSISQELFQDIVRQKGLEQYVKYVGPRYNAEKFDLLSGSDIFAFPTAKDCFPLVLLEAMAYSLPIVTTNEGAISEIIDDEINGFIIPTHDPKTLAEKLELLISNPELRRQMGTHGKAKYDQKYRLEVFHNNLVSVLRSIICRP